MQGFLQTRWVGTSPRVASSVKHSTGLSLTMQELEEFKSPTQFLSPRSDQITQLTR